MEIEEKRETIFSLSLSFYLYVSLCFCLRGALTLLMSKPCVCLLSSLQTWQWAVRLEERSVEAEYWSLTVTGTYPRKAWCWARSWEQPGPAVAACLDLDSLCEEAKTWTTISILVNTHTEQVGPPLLCSPCCIKILSPTCIPSLLHSPSSFFH